MHQPSPRVIARHPHSSVTAALGPGARPAFTTVSLPAAILRPTSQLQLFVGLTGGLLVYLVCSMPSPSRTPNFQLCVGRGLVNLVCPQPPIGPGW